MPRWRRRSPDGSARIGGPSQEGRGRGPGQDRYRSGRCCTGARRCGRRRSWLRSRPRPQRRRMSVRPHRLGSAPSAMRRRPRTVWQRPTRCGMPRVSRKPSRVSCSTSWSWAHEQRFSPEIAAENMNAQLVMMLRNTKINVRQGRQPCADVDVGCGGGQDRGEVGEDPSGQGADEDLRRSVREQAATDESAKAELTVSPRRRRHFLRTRSRTPVWVSVTERVDMAEVTAQDMRAEARGWPVRDLEHRARRVRDRDRQPHSALIGLIVAGLALGGCRVKAWQQQ